MESKTRPIAVRERLADSARSGWLLVTCQEFKDIWTGGRGLIPLILFSVLLSGLSVLLVTDIELSLLPPDQMVFLTLQVTIAMGLLVGLLIAADSISGERERATLEGLLLTPTSRRQIIMGKYLAAFATWPAAFLIASAYMAVLSPPGAFLGRALIWGLLLGSLSVMSLTGVALLASIWSSSNKTSFAMSLFTCLLFVLPTLIPGTPQPGMIRELLQKVNPIDSANRFLTDILLSEEPLMNASGWLIAPTLFVVAVLGFLFLYVSPGVRLDAGRTKLRGSGWQSATLFLLTLLAGFGLDFALAKPVSQAAKPQRIPLKASLDMSSQILKKGDKIELRTSLLNQGSERTAPLMLALNLVNSDVEKSADPEDWLPERTQAVESLGAGESVDHLWTLHAVVEGDYQLYFAVLPQSANALKGNATIAGTNRQFKVVPFSPLDPGRVISLAVAMPIVLTLGFFFLRQRRRRMLVVADS